LRIGQRNRPQFLATGCFDEFDLIVVNAGQLTAVGVERDSTVSTSEAARTER
jgi:hypothetical protein